MFQFICCRELSKKTYFSFNHLHIRAICFNRLHLICLHSIFSFLLLAFFSNIKCQTRVVAEEEKKRELNWNRNGKSFTYFLSMRRQWGRMSFQFSFTHFLYSCSSFFRLVCLSHSLPVCLPFVPHIHVEMSLSIRLCL